MTDAPLQSGQDSVQSTQSPPPSPPITDQGSKLSRKREREVSLEPVSNPAKGPDTDVRQETRTPAKKNRTSTQLDPTEEEDDGISRSSSGSRSPPLSTSPPHEIKMRVRQISQGVEDLSWRNTKNAGKEQTEVENNGLQPTADIIHTKNQVAYPEIPVAPTPDNEVTPAKPPGSQELSETSGNSNDTDNIDKGLKRKFLERGTSTGPPESSGCQSAVEPLKRPRDDADKDDNPRESKRPSPPPEPKSPKSPKKVPQAASSAPKLSGFMAYASSSSPFAAVKGKNLFSKQSSPSLVPAFTANQVPANSPFSALSNAGEPSTSTGMRFGFEAFTGSAPPFSSAARSKSPVLGSASRLGRSQSPSRRVNPSHAFASYAGGVQGFSSLPPPKHPREGSPEGSSRGSSERNTIFKPNGGSDSGDEDHEDREVSFGEELRAGRDDDDQGGDSDEQSKIVLTEQEVLTGEEDEQTIHQIRGKLYSLVDGTWKERGTGTLKLNVRRSDGHGARLVMRKEAVFTLLLNVALFHGMRCTIAQDPRYLRFSVIEGNKTTHYNLKLASAKIAQGLLEEINANIPMS